MTTNIDDTIRALFQKLEERKQAVAHLRAKTEQKWKTNGTFRLLGASATTNLMTAPSDALDEIVVHLSILVMGQRQAAELLKREFKANIYGYPVQDWLDDVSKRHAMIAIRDEEKKLTELELRLNSVLSPEERRRIEVALLVQEISD